MSDALRAPLLLLAMPQIRDPFFERSVVLLVAHELDGSLGFVLNRPTDLKVEEILDDLDLAWGGPETECAFLGGPVEPQVGSVLFPSDAADPLVTEAAAPVSPQISLTRNLTVFSQLASAPPSTLRLLLGHAGWSPGQLDEEVLRHDWLTAPAHKDLVFADPSEVWRLSLERIGIDHQALPEWTTPDLAAN